MCTNVHGHLLKRVFSASMAPDRTMSNKGRLIWDGSGVPNTHCPKGDHPPADQPRHEDLARVILWWRARLPGVPLLMSKQDVADAFRWVVMHEMDACIFGADLEGGKWGVAGLITAVYMVHGRGWPSVTTLRFARLTPGGMIALPSTALP